ncbi:MAG: ATP-binding protein, partial [Allosphingosinicella sp.]
RRIAAELLADVAAAAAPGQPLAAAFQDYAVRCRMRGVAAPAGLDAFRRDFAMARAGIESGEGWEEALALAGALPEEMLAPFLALARAAREEAPCPTDEALARLYGTSSTSRARWMLAAMEEKGLVVSRVDLAGKRTIALPHLGWRTAPAVAGPAKPSRLARIAGREAARGRL